MIRWYGPLGFFCLANEVLSTRLGGSFLFPHPPSLPRDGFPQRWKPRWLLCYGSHLFSQQLLECCMQGLSLGHCLLSSTSETPEILHCLSLFPFFFSSLINFPEQLRGTSCAFEALILSLQSHRANQNCLFSVSQQQPSTDSLVCTSIRKDCQEEAAAFLNSLWKILPLWGFRSEPCCSLITLKTWILE